MVSPINFPVSKWDPEKIANLFTVVVFFDLQFFTFYLRRHKGCKKKLDARMGVLVLGKRLLFVKDPPRFPRK